MRLKRIVQLVLIIAMPFFVLTSLSGSIARVPVPISLAAREDPMGSFSLRDAKFATIPHISTRASCEATQPPEALATPNPLLDMTDIGNKVTVSFIVGTDGRVHSPLILQSAGFPIDRTILDAVRSWRYRPATCNGVPTEAEGNVEFSAR
jgi:TonB family protein